MPFDDDTTDAFTLDDIQRTTKDAAEHYYKTAKERNTDSPSRNGLFEYLRAHQDPRVKLWFSVNGTPDYVDNLYQEIKEEYYGNTRAAQTDTASRPDPTFEHWLSVAVPPLVPLLGEFITTTSRVILIAPTGLGKTMFCLAMATAVGDGTDFLHWTGSGSPKRVLYIEGEMSRRQIKARITDAVRRHRAFIGDPLRKPPFVHLISREEYPDMPYLDTPGGQKYIDDFIEDKMGGCDLIIFDSVMSLLKGDERFGEDSWKRTLPWSCQLTRREIGQVWIHHTGIDESHGHGTKTREWQVDTAVLLQRTTIIENEGETIDLHFTCKFTKMRERSPENAADFANVEVTLGHDTWCSSQDMRASAVDNSAKNQALEILKDTIISDGLIQEQLVSDVLCVPRGLWRERYIAVKLNGSATKPDSIERAWRRQADKLVKEAKVAEGKIGKDPWVWLPATSGADTGQPDRT